MSIDRYLNHKESSLFILAVSLGVGSAILLSVPVHASAFSSESYTISGYQIGESTPGTKYSENYSMSGVTVDSLPEAEEEEPSLPTIPDSQSGSRARVSAYMVTSTVPTREEFLGENEPPYSAVSPVLGMYGNEEDAYASNVIANGGTALDGEATEIPSREGEDTTENIDTTNLASVVAAPEVPFIGRLFILCLVLLGLLCAKRYTTIGRRFLPF